jgi:hypothetical protein
MDYEEHTVAMAGGGRSLQISNASGQQTIGMAANCG